jgi:hypothetical protein
MLRYRMTARFLFVLAMFLGLALAPVKPRAACVIVPAAPSCHGCCAAAEHACCAPATPLKPAPIAPTASSDDGKQLAAPALVFLCFSPIPAAERPVVRRLQATRFPAVSLLDLNCARLI